MRSGAVMDALNQHISNPRVLMLLSCECPRRGEKKWLHSNHVISQLEKIREKETLLLLIQQ